MNKESRNTDLGPQSELGPLIKSFSFRLPLDVHKRVLEFCARTGSAEEAVIHEALREQVSWIEAHTVAVRPVERWDVFLPLELVNRLRDLCAFNGLDRDAVIESALLHLIESARRKQVARAPRELRVDDAHCRKVMRALIEE